MPVTVAHPEIVPAKPERTAEEQLAHERAVLQYIVDNVPALIFWKDRQSVYLGCNRGFAALGGKDDPRELVGRTDYDMAWRQFADQYRAGDRELFERGEPILYREEPMSDGKVILTSKVPMRDQAGEMIGVLGIIFDITERKHLELELREAKEKAESAAQARSDFIANVTHELRTPLTLILGPVDDMLRDPALPPEFRSVLERVRRNGARLHGLVDDVLEFSRAEAGHHKARPAPMDLVAAMRALVHDMQPLAASQQLELETPLQSLPVSLDPKLVERILLNLVGNALKFTPAPGLIVVSLSHEPAAGTLRIAVTDSGPGIPKSAQVQLFRPFAQLDASKTRRAGGTGLGLALVRRCAEAMGGIAGVDSEEGQGSTFWVVLPAQTVEHELVPVEPVHIDRPAPAQASPARLAGAAPVVLVAEDNVDLRAYIAETLYQGGFGVVAVENGQLAWEQLGTRRFDVVVSDVMMPELDGLGLLARIKGDPQLAHLPVLLLTALAGPGEAAAGLGAGADDYLPKPFSAEELCARVRAAVRMSRLQEELRARSHEAGRAGVAAGLLHNLGNVLGSAHVSASLIEETLRHSPVESVHKVAQLLMQHGDDLGRFMSQEPGKLVPALLDRLGDSLLAEQRAMASELALLQQKLEHVQRVVAAYHELASPAGVDELLCPAELVETALQLVPPGEGIEVVRALEPTPLVRADKHKVLQILSNLLKNARESLQASGHSDPKLSVSTERQDANVLLTVADNGLGVEPSAHSHLFVQGFTTKRDGSGLGLHTSALLARELGGALRFSSDGRGHGASFVLQLPAGPASEG
jgi:two-component system sensor histidine kinase ChiS